MLFGAYKSMCASCRVLVQWMGGLTLIIFGVVGLLDEMMLIMDPHWGIVWPVTAIMWGLLTLLHVGCKDCK